MFKFKKVFGLKAFCCCCSCFKRSKTLKHSGHVLQQQSRLQTAVFLLMEALFRARTLLLSFPSRPAFARREETLTSGLWWVNVRLHWASESQKCFLCCFLVNGICSVMTEAVCCSFCSKIHILVKTRFCCYSGSIPQWISVSTCFTSFLNINESYLCLWKLHRIIYLWWRFISCCYRVAVISYRQIGGGLLPAVDKLWEIAGDQ